MSQDALAAAVQVEKGTVYRLEHGKTTPTRNNVKRIARYFGVAFEPLWAMSRGGPAVGAATDEVAGQILVNGAADVAETYAAISGVPLDRWVSNLVQWYAAQSGVLKEMIAREMQEVYDAARVNQLPDEREGEHGGGEPNGTPGSSSDSLPQEDATR